MMHSTAMNPIYLKAIKPPAVLTNPTIAVGMAPTKSRPAITFLGPKRSQSGPTIKRAAGKRKTPILAKYECGQGTLILNLSYL